MRLTADHRKRMVNIPPRCMKTTIPIMTEEQNKQQYESFITSAIHIGAWDAIISYKEWLQSICAYKPMQDNSVLRLSTKDAEKFVEMFEKPPKPSEELKRLLKPEEVIAGDNKVRTHEEWSVLLQQEV